MGCISLILQDRKVDSQTGYHSCLGSHSAVRGSEVWTWSCLPALNSSFPHFQPPGTLVTSAAWAVGGQSKWLPVKPLCLSGWTSWFCLPWYTCLLLPHHHPGTTNTAGRENMLVELGLAGGEPLSPAGCPCSLCTVVGSMRGFWVWEVLAF